MHDPLGDGGSSNKVSRPSGLVVQNTFIRVPESEMSIASTQTILINFLK